MALWQKLREEERAEKKWNLEKADNTNVALPYMASTINSETVKNLHTAMLC